MVRPLIRLLAVAAAVAALASCQVLGFIFGSVFPGTTTLLTARVDLSGQISSNDGYGCNVRVVESGGNSYVVVTAPQPDEGTTTAFFYDLDLNLKTTLSGLTSNGVVVGVDGNILVGNALLDPSSLQPVDPQPETGVTAGGYNHAGIDGFVNTASGTNITRLDVHDSSGVRSLAYMPYSSSWGSLSEGSEITTPLPSELSNFNLTAVLDDGDPSGYVYLVLSEQSGGSGKKSYFVKLLKSDFTGATGEPAIPSDLPSRDGLETESFGFAQGSIFAYDSDSSSFVRMDPATADTQGSFIASQGTSNTRFAYRTSGGVFYVFDTRSRVLSKYKAWW